jgi:formyl-CoA transferase
LDKIAPSNIFQSSDHRWVLIAANQDSLFRSLCRVMDRPELIGDVRFADHAARGDHQDEIDQIISDWAATKSADELDEMLNNAGIPAGPVNTVREVVANEHLRARDAFTVHDDLQLGKILGPGVVPRLSRTPGSVRWSGPWEPGAYNADVYSNLLGLPDTEIERLRSAGVV